MCTSDLATWYDLKALPSKTPSKIGTNRSGNRWQLCANSSKWCSKSPSPVNFKPHRLTVFMTSISVISFLADDSGTRSCTDQFPTMARSRARTLYQQLCSSQ